MRTFRAVLIAGWALLAMAAAAYAHIKAIPAAVAFPLALAFLAEYPFYLLPGFATARDRFVSTAGRTKAASVFAAGAVAPWLVYAIGTGHFNFSALVLVACIAVPMCFWYIVFPRNAAVDLIYLCLFAVIILLKVFARVYPNPWPKLDVSVLGHVMLIRAMAFSFMAIRGSTGADYRFMPTAREWMAGLRWFAMLLPVVGVVYWRLGLVVLRPHPLNIFLGTGTFFGILWLTAISEEFIFRGLLQPWIGRWTSSPMAGLAITSVLFGSVHLGFHGAFPNWRFSIAAAILGLFCGLARRRTGGIQAGMVAHALTVAVWKMFLL